MIRISVSASRLLSGQGTKNTILYVPVNPTWDCVQFLVWVSAWEVFACLIYFHEYHYHYFHILICGFGVFSVCFFLHFLWYVFLFLLHLCFHGIRWMCSYKFGVLRLNHPQQCEVIIDVARCALQPWANVLSGWGVHHLYKHLPVPFLLCLWLELLVAGFWQSPWISDCILVCLSILIEVQ